MSKYIIYFFAIFFMILTAATSDAGVNVNINIGEHGPDGYYHSLSDFYRVDYDDVYHMRNRGISDERIPVILQIASLADVPPRQVARRYGPGVSLMELTRIYGLTPEIYYIPVKVKVDGPPYGKAYGYYRNRARKEWKNIYLDDYDIINLSNLRFMSGYYDVEPDVIIKKRSSGKNFIVINDDFRGGKKSKHGYINNDHNQYEYNEDGHQDNHGQHPGNSGKGKGGLKGKIKGNGKAKGNDKKD